MNTLSKVGGELFDWILQATWQAAVLAGLILLAQWMLGKRLSPGWRYGLWLLLVFRLLMPVAPQSAFSIFNLAPIPRPASADKHPERAGPVPAVARARPGSIA